MLSESDPKPFYIRHNKDGTRDEYVLQDGWSEVLHRHVTPCVYRSGADRVRDVRTWEADEFYGENNVPPRAKLALQKLREAVQRMREVSSAHRT
ncbi:hypothetical protein RSO01_63120 [Reyranella soli]|jgi:hypothetical protein|uniref:Uncharacterized protein n=1 Tax=Reyranella soli TaxID=1230389 RepID=A0A512NJM6_9HYPH|nr:hypothetical protein RSO01_63120 [Reyranella soli]